MSTLDQLSPDERDVRLTALALGELPEQEAAELRQEIAGDSELARAFEARCKVAGLVRETIGAHETISVETPLRLSSDRREKLLAMFKPEPESPARSFARSGWYVPLTMAAVLAGLLLVATVLLRQTNQKYIALRSEIEARAPAAGERGSLRAARPSQTPAAGPASGPINKGEGNRWYSSDKQAGKSPAPVPLPAKRLADSGVVLRERRARAEAESLAAQAKEEKRRSVVENGRQVTVADAPFAAPKELPARPLSSLESLVVSKGGSVVAGDVTESYSISPVTVPLPEINRSFFDESGFKQLEAKETTLGRAGTLNQTVRLGTNVQAPAFLSFSTNTTVGFNFGKPVTQPNREFAYFDDYAERSGTATDGRSYAANGAAPADSLGLATVPLPATRSSGATIISGIGQAVPAGSPFGAGGGGFSGRKDDGQGIHGVEARGYVETAQSKAPLTSEDAAGTPIDLYRRLAEPKGTSVLQDSDGDVSLKLELDERTRRSQSAARDEKKVEERLLKLPATSQFSSTAAGLAPVAQNAPSQPSSAADPATARPAVPPPIPQPEVATRDNPFSTFSLNVADVSFRLAAATLERGGMPEAGGIRVEEFINAFDYRDPQPAGVAAIAFASERARYPFAHNREVLRLSVKTAAQGREPGRPLNLVLLLDNSGSMERADRVQIINEAMTRLAGEVRPEDKLSLVTFARTARLWFDGVSGSQAAEVAARAGTLTPEGGTNLEEALRLGYQTALRHVQAGAINRVILLTDGAANLGDVDASRLKAQVEQHRKQGIALDCFGIGWEGFNDDLLEELSRNGDGRYAFVNTPEEAATDFAGQVAGALRVAASDVKVQVEFNPRRVTSYRQVGYAKHQLTSEQFRDNTVDAAEIGAAEAGNALYVIETDPAGDGHMATVRVRYKVPSTGEHKEHEFTVPYTPAVPIEQANPTLRLAVSAAAFAESLSQNPYAAEVTNDALLRLLGGVPEAFGAGHRARNLEWMIRQAKSISGR